jgi:hypothetical protein
MSEFQINNFLSSQPDGKTKPVMTVEEVAMGFIRVANEAMCRPIRALTQVQIHSFSAMHQFGVINKTYSEHYFNDDSLKSHLTLDIGFVIHTCQMALSELNDFCLDSIHLLSLVITFCAVSMYTYYDEVSIVSAISNRI